MEPLQVALCEDAPDEQTRLLKILKESFTPCKATVFSCGEDFLQAFRPGKFDLVMMDIYMRGISGIETITRLRTQDDAVPVAFITTSTEHTLESYRLDALKYIEKPANPKAVAELLRLALLQKESIPCLHIRVRGLETSVPFRRILYAEQQDHTLNFYLTGGDCLQAVERLDVIAPLFVGQPFFRCHKSYLVNLAQVKALDGALRLFTMKEGGNVLIRRESLGAARKAFEAYLFSAARGKTNA